MRIISLVAEGLEQAAAAGCLTWLFGQQADVICLQDTRCSEASLKGSGFFPPDYHAYFLDHYENSQLNGVAIYSRVLPKAITWGFGADPWDAQGRYIQADFDQISVGSLLVPSALPDKTNKAEKMQFLAAFGAHLRKIRHKRRGFVLCGGWELMAHRSDAEDSINLDAAPGVSLEEREWLLDLYDLGYSDACSQFGGEAAEFTWWPQGDEAGGLRTDTQIISESLAGAVSSVLTCVDEAFSAHAPIIVDYDLTL